MMFPKSWTDDQYHKSFKTNMTFISDYYDILDSNFEISFDISLQIIKSNNTLQLVGYLTQVGLLQQHPKCSICKNKTQLKQRIVKNKTYYYWGCSKRLNPHYIANSIYKDSIFFKTHIEKNVLTFIIFHIFILDYSITEQIVIIKEFLNISISKVSWVKINTLLRKIVRKNWLEECISPFIYSEYKENVYHVYWASIASLYSHTFWLIVIYDITNGNIRMNCLTVNEVDNTDNCLISEITRWIPLNHLTSQSIILDITKVNETWKNKLQNIGYHVRFPIESPEKLFNKQEFFYKNYLKWVKVTDNYIKINIKQMKSNLSPSMIVNTCHQYILTWWTFFYFKYITQNLSFIEYRKMIVKIINYDY